MNTTYTTHGTCSQYIDIETDGDILVSVRFVGGCPGNTKGVAILAAGRPVSEVIDRLSGIVCRNGTSCPDQLARALESISLKKASGG